MRGRHCLSHWSRTQATVALSSAEAELNAALKGAVELLGAGAMMEEAGQPMMLELEGDSTACKGVLTRQGSGRIKHLEVRQLWLQEHVQSGKAVFTKVPREVNMADTQTKHWESSALSLMGQAGFTILPEGRVLQNCDEMYLCTH